MCSVVDTYIPDEKNRTFVMMRSPIDGLWLPLSYIGGGGMCIRWFRDQLSGNPVMHYDVLEEEAKQIVPGSDELLFCPHFSGRVLPPSPELKGAFIGLDFNHTRAHMYRSVLESIAYEYAGYLQILKDNFKAENFEKLDVIGGGSKCRLFNQIKADVLQVPVETYEMGETALIGSAAVAGMAIGMTEDYRAKISKSIRRQMYFEPDEKSGQIYQAKVSQYKEMLKILGAR